MQEPVTTKEPTRQEMIARAAFDTLEVASNAFVSCRREHLAIRLRDASNDLRKTITDQDQLIGELVEALKTANGTIQMQRCTSSKMYSETELAGEDAVHCMIGEAIAKAHKYQEGK